MKILVTGGCGFIGRNLIPYLLHANHVVCVLDNYSVGKPSALTGLGVELIQGDVRDLETARDAVRGVEAVIHLAAQTGVIPSQQNPALDFQVNALGTLNLLVASRDAGVRRFVFASSNAPLGTGTLPITESHPPQPLSPYGASKLAGEGYCSAFYNSYGLPTVALRFSNVYGPRSDHKESVVARFARDVLVSGQMSIYGDGQQTRDLLHVDDLSRAIAYALEAEPLGGMVIQIATGVETRILDLAYMIRTALERPEAHIRFLPARAGEMRRNYACNDRARQILNWQPQIAVESGVPQTCKWFMEGWFSKAGADNTMLSRETSHV